MKKYLITLIFLLNTSLTVFSQSIMTPEKIVNIMSNRFETMRGFSASFVERNDDKLSRGKIIYKKPNKFKMTYNAGADNQAIYCNGETLWIFLPKIKVVSEQKLDNTSSGGFYTKNGVGRLVSQYNFDFYGERALTPINAFKDSELNITGYNSSSYISSDTRPAYHMLLTPKQASVDKTGFTKIHLWVAQDGMILRILGISTTKAAIEYVFDTINYNDIYNDEAFEPEIPQGMQVLRNALVPK